jgi:putative ABC transport system substrate-binding protein
VRRRETLFGAAALAMTGWPVAAQEAPKTARIGFIVTGDAFPRRYFDEAMERLGWIEGRNLSVERRVTGEDPESRRAAAAELAASTPDVIVAAGVIDARSVFATTRTIPIVVVAGTDLVENGLVESLARPGGNLTGTTHLGGELDGKRLELLHELIPAATRVAVTGAVRTSIARMAALAAVARRLGVSLYPRPVGNLEEMDAAYSASAAAGDQAILVYQTTIAFENQAHIIALAAQLRLPAIYEVRDYVENGGLISYGQVWRESFERAASLVDKILKGAKPADLPVEQPRKFELVINSKTAKALGLALPQSILMRADEVIE